MDFLGLSIICSIRVTPPVSYQSPELDLPLYASSGLAKYPEVDHPRLTLRTLKVTSCMIQRMNRKAIQK